MATVKEKPRIKTLPEMVGTKGGWSHPGPDKGIVPEQLPVTLSVGFYRRHGYPNILHGRIL